MKRLRGYKILALVLSPLVLSPITSHAVSLENSKIRIQIDDKGRVTELTDTLWPDMNLIGTPGDGFWRLNLQKDRSLENIVWPQDQTYKVREANGEIIVSIDSLKMRHETLPIQLEFHITLKDDEVHWSVHVTNHSTYTVAELTLPDLEGVRSLSTDQLHDVLYWPEGLGGRIPDFENTLVPRQGGLTHLSIAVNRLQDPFIELTYPYPASMAWCTLNNGQRGVYFAAHDPTALPGTMMVGRRLSEGGGLFFSYDKYPFVGPNKSWSSADYVTSFYAGDWHVAADKYKSFLQTWRIVRDKPEWAKNTQGMYLVIMKQQYGDTLWRYDELPDLYREAQKNGLDTLGIFGWTKAGHDDQYPEYEPDPGMGGATALKDALAKVRQMGGNTILYIQGRLIDPTTSQYPNAVHDYASLNMWGTPYYEEYSKAEESSLLRNFSRKTLVETCPDIPEWTDLLEQKGRDVMKFNPSGIIYDQIGGAHPYPCFNKGITETPAEAYVHGRLQLLAALRANLRDQRPDAGFLVELVTDVFSQYPDIVHCSGTACQYDKEAFPSMFRYTVPDVIVTARHTATRPDPIEVNYAFTYGLRFELELRYREEQDEVLNNIHPEMSEYLKDLTQLRRRHWSLLGTGTFLNADNISEPNTRLTSTLFGDGKAEAVITWNNTKSPQLAEPTLKGMRLVGSDGVSGVNTAGSTTLQPQEVRVWLFEPEL